MTARLSSLPTCGLRGWSQAHSVAAVSIVVAPSLLGVEQVILRPVSLGPLSEPCGHDGQGS